MWWRILLGLFFLAHGFVHARWRTSWLLSYAGESTLRGLSSILLVLVAVGFFATGVAVFVQQGWWRTLAVVSSIVSLLVLGLLWNRGLVVGIAVDVAILIALLWAHWPSASQVGS